MAVVSALGLLIGVGWAAAPLNASSVEQVGAAADRTAALEPAGTRQRPNILLILTDDQRADTQVAMPTVMREIFGKGTAYPNAVIPTSWCCPSRASLLTGKFSHNTGVWENASNHDYGAWQAFHYGGEEADTIATRLDSVGYQTGLFGKYLNDFRPHMVDSVPGWDTMAAFLGGNYSDYRLSNDPVGTKREGREYLTDALADQAVDFMSDSLSRGRPFFTYFSPFAPHYPYDPGPYTGKTRARGLLDDLFAAANWPSEAVNETDVSDKPRWIRRLPVTKNWVELNPARDQGWSIAEVAERQADALLGVDAAVGKMIRALRDRDALENTLIIFLSDNGYAWGEHRTQGKNTPYDASVRVPLAIRFDKGGIPATVDPRIAAANIDVYATILEIAGAAAPEVDGRSLLSPQPRDGVLVEATRWRGQRDRPAYCGWRTTEDLYVRYSDGFEEFYDYGVDPLELNNVATDPAFTERIERSRARTRVECSPTPPDFTWTPRTHVPFGPATNVTASALPDGRLEVWWRAPSAIGRANLTYVVRGAGGRSSKPLCRVVARESEGLYCRIKVRRAMPNKVLVEVKSERVTRTSSPVSVQR